ATDHPPLPHHPVKHTGAHTRPTRSGGSPRRPARCRARDVRPVRATADLAADAGGARGQAVAGRAARSSEHDAEEGDRPDQARAALEGRNFWSVATASRAGVPQSTVMWVMLRDGRIVLNSALGRKKVDKLRENPHVALSWADPENPYVSFGIQGRVVDELV